MNLVKSKRRVADHGEVFTPAWLVEAMLDLVKEETERIDSRFLEPACGSGNFLVPVLRRKLAAVQLKYGKSDFERRHYALLGLMCIYGIELLADNIAECRANVLEIFAEYLNLENPDELYRAAFYVLSQNLVHGDALAMRTHPQRLANILKDRPCRHRGLVTTSSAYDAASGGRPTSHVLAPRAYKPARPPQLHQVLSASFLGAKPVLQLQNCARVVFHAPKH